MQLVEISFITITVLIINSLGEKWDYGHKTDNCPKQCLCQHNHFTDLSVSRWINTIQLNRNEKNFQELDNEDLVNENEAFFEGDESFSDNPRIKQATCILQSNSDQKELFNNLPPDLQSLVILYTGGELRNFTVPTSDLGPLNQLSTLELRGPKDKSLRLLIDEPLPFLKNVNFESIQLIGSENSKRPKNPVHPSESFDYVPNSEKANYNLSLETEPEEEIEIVPYEVYKMEIKKSRMPSFYGWEHLKILRIHNCMLDELHWEMFNGLTELQHLSLEENKLKVIPAFAFYGAMHIKTLSLAKNEILDLNYRDLAGLLDLEILNLSENNLTKLSELTFPPFPKLEFIDFRANPIHYIFPATFGVMNTTKIMYLGSSYLKLELSANNPFESLNLLKHLIITNVSIDTLEQNIFKETKNLEILIMQGEIQRIEFDAFAGLSALRELNLSNCKILEISMDSFIGCKHLEIIDLSYNKLSYIPPGIFDDQNELYEIYLQGNLLKFLPASFFSTPSLRLVRLTENPWKCSCDMAIWVPKITNQNRDRQMERCIKDFHTGKSFSCKKVSNYVFDNQLSPRCINLKQRSVYYALRKDLHCDFKKEFEKNLKLRSGGGRKGSKFKYLEERKERKSKRLDHNKAYKKEESIIIDEINIELRRDRLIQKQQEKIKNSLQYLINNNNNNNYNQNTNKKDITDFNNILGPVDESYAFNSI